jgi:hypothetical protein
LWPQAETTRLLSRQELNKSELLLHAAETF